MGKPQVHIVERLEPTRVLKVCFDPLLKVMIPMGIFPVRINEIGWATYTVCQPQLACYIIFTGIFIFITCIYAPFYLDTMEKLGITFVFEVAKYLFVCGQHLAAAITLIMVPVLSGRVTKVWNKLQQLVVQITVCHSTKCFIRVYRLTRVIMGLWILVVVTSWYLWWKSFFSVGLFQTYFGSGGFMYYFHILGCIVMSTLISAHVLHSIFFILLAATLRMCYRTIAFAAIELECHLPSKTVYEQLNEKLNKRKVCCELVDAYGRTTKLVVYLGKVYGRYMIVEMFAFFSSALTSFFAMFDNFDAIRLETVIITLVINIIWFCGLCECGQMLLDEELKCFQLVKKIASRCDMPSNWMLEKFMGESLKGLTAANYFTFKRKLVTAAVVSLVTYLIVMLQFKAADTTNSLVQETVRKLGNLTFEFMANVHPELLYKT